MGIAGLWAYWRATNGADVLSLAMLTINADGHPVMRRFHKPGDEKRMAAILVEVDHDRWLEAPVTTCWGCCNGIRRKGCAQNPRRCRRGREPDPSGY